MSAVEGWEKKTLRELATINYGKSPANVLADDGAYPVVGTGGQDRRGNDYLHDGESIILGRKGTIDRVYFMKSKFWAIDTAYYLNDFTETAPRWLYYFLQTIDLRQMNEATGVPSLSRDLLYKIEIHTPPKSEQAKIAEILSTVDKAIEQTEALIAKQQRIKTGLMQDLLTRGIDEHGNLRSEKTHKFKDSPLGRIPVEWEVVQIEKICSDIVDCPHSTPVYTESGVPCIRTADMEPGHLLLASAFCVDEVAYRDRVMRLVPQTGDIIYSREGERLGIASPVGDNRVCLGQRVMLLRPDCRTDPNYLLWSMNEKDFYLRAVSGLGATTSPHINVKDIRKALVKKPYKNEQKNIGTILATHHNQLRINQDFFLKLSRLKTALMQDLLTGKKRVTDLLK